MTNHERYKQAFSALHASENISLEVKPMKKANLKFSMRPVVAICLCAAVLIGGAGVAYAADVGGIRETIQVWFGGRQVDATITGPTGSGGGGYEFTVDLDGDVKTFGGGGVAIDGDGSERRLTPEEVVDGFSTQVDTDENGRVWLYRYDKSYDITDLMENGACKVALDEEGKTLYIDIQDNQGGGYQFSVGPEPVGAEEDYTVLE